MMCIHVKQILPNPLDKNAFHIMYNAAVEMAATGNVEAFDSIYENEYFCICCDHVTNPYNYRTLFTYALFNEHITFIKYCGRKLGVSYFNKYINKQIIMGLANMKKYNALRYIAIKYDKKLEICDRAFLDDNVDLFKIFYKDSYLISIEQQKKIFTRSKKLIKFILNSKIPIYYSHVCQINSEYLQYLFNIDEHVVSYFKIAIRTKDLQSTLFLLQKYYIDGKLNLKTSIRKFINRYISRICRSGFIKLVKFIHYNFLNISYIIITAAYIPYNMDILSFAYKINKENDVNIENIILINIAITVAIIKKNTRVLKFFNNKGHTLQIYYIKKLVHEKQVKSIRSLQEKYTVFSKKYQYN